MYFFLSVQPEIHLKLQQWSSWTAHTDSFSAVCPGSLQPVDLKNGCWDFSQKTQPYAGQPQTSIPSSVYLEETLSRRWGISVQALQGKQKQTRKRNGFTSSITSSTAAKALLSKWILL